jgi:8-hydroxy-5-deazaflavin:NADPH oxidoreductase
MSKAESVIAQLYAKKGERDYLKANLEPAENQEVVSRCEFLIAAVPHSTALQSIAQLAPFFKGNQILVSAISVVMKSGTEFNADFGETSIAQQIQRMLGKSIKVATAFQTVPAHILYKEKTISADVLVACDDKNAYQTIADVILSISGLRPLYTGSLNVARSIEGLTAVLLDVAINNQLKSPTLKLNSF